MPPVRHYDISYETKCEVCVEGTFVCLICSKDFVKSQHIALARGRPACFQSNCANAKSSPHISSRRPENRSECPILSTPTQHQTAYNSRIRSYSQFPSHSLCYVAELDITLCEGYQATGVPSLNIIGDVMVGLNQIAVAPLKPREPPRDIHNRLPPAKRPRA
jgi:hypothetical protein